jgi:transcription initiation factor TFIIIB Brf1 subunit/transcription initiation factor TFIIB
MTDFKRTRKVWKLFDKKVQKTTDVLKMGEKQVENMMETATGANDICPNCRVGEFMVMDDGFSTCQTCRMILTTELDYSPEWNSFGKDDKSGNDTTRCGNPANPLLKESSTACKVMHSCRSTYEMRKIEKNIEWMSMPHREKTLWDEFQYITNIGRMGGISQKIIDDALIKHKEISEQQMFRGVNRDSIKAASIYIAYRQNGFPRTATEIAQIFYLDKKHATKGCALAVSILNNIERNSESQTQLCKVTPSLIIERYCGHFQMGEDEVMLARFMAHKIESLTLIRDNTPQAITCGIVYYLSQLCALNITKQDIIAKCRISDVTVAKCYKKIASMEEQLVPPCVLTKYRATIPVGLP